MLRKVSSKLKPKRESQKSSARKLSEEQGAAVPYFSEDATHRKVSGRKLSIIVIGTKVNRTSVGFPIFLYSAR